MGRKQRRAGSAECRVGARAGAALGAVALAAALTTTVGLAGPAQAMSGGTQLPRPGAAPWLATLAKKGDDPLLDRASCGGVPTASSPRPTA